MRKSAEAQPPRLTPEDALRQWVQAASGGAIAARREPASVRLAGWLDWTDAIELAAVLDGRGADSAAMNAIATPAQPPKGSPAPISPHALLEQGRARLLAGVQATVRDAVDDWKADQARRDAARDAGGPTGSADLSILRRAVAQAQRQLEAGVSRHRATLRAQLAAGTAAQRELASLDAVLEQALLERQRHLLAGAAARVARLGENGEVAGVERGLMAALAAELELRLQPLQGLAQALQPIESTHP